MVSLVTGLRGLLLYGLVTLTASRSEPENYAVIGGSFTLPLDYKPLNINDELKWKHGEKVILRRKNGEFKPGKAEDIDAAGSLTLKDLKAQDAGIYTAEVYDSDGKSQKEWTGKLNVLEVTKPMVKFTCPTGKATSVLFTCEVPQPQDLTFSWTLNGKDPGKSDRTLSRALSDLKSVSSVSCSVKNKANNKEISTEINPTCGGSSFPSELFGFDFWPMVAILAAGGGLVLLLLVITLVCCCRVRRRNQRRQEEGEELRLQWSHQQPPVEQPSMPSQQHRPRHPIPKATGQAAAQPRAQASNRPPQAYSKDDDDEEPPPLPKPRKKRHRPPQDNLS